MSINLLLATKLSKSFDIEHPSKEGKRLIHGSLEGPEHGVYIGVELMEKRKWNYQNIGLTLWIWIQLRYN